MICAKCKDAGRLTLILRNTKTTPETERARKTVIRNLHKSCRGGTWCDCQHRAERKSLV